MKKYKVKYEGLPLKLKKYNTMQWDLYMQLTEATGIFGEGMKVLDYGCGQFLSYADFLSGRLKDFTYYGLELKNTIASKSIIATESIMTETVEDFSDPRIKLGFIGDDIEEEAYNIVDGIILSSIFTHLRFDKFEDELLEGQSFVTICNKFKPFLDRGGVVSFSAWIDNSVHQVGDNYYNVKGSYKESYYTLDKLEEYVNLNNMIITKCGEHFDFSESHHIIFSIRRIG